MDQTEQLDLFFDGPQAPLAPRPAPPPERTGPVVPTARPPSLPQNARWREVQAPQQAIGYVLQRSRRKSIGLTINDDGLRVTAPNWVTLGQVDAAVLDKASWILGKLRARQARQQQLATAATQWREGGEIPYLGAYVVLALDGTQTLPAFSGAPLAPRSGDILRLALPVDADRNRVRDSAHAWLQQQASLHFGRRLQHFLDANGLTIKRWRLSSAATRWGSCSSEGNIMLNWRLIHFSHDIIDYVIAHEIAHLREMNHGGNFWREVGRILPGFETARNALRQHDPGSLPLL
jgi:predicted metal-dependent hydrolase